MSDFKKDMTEYEGYAEFVETVFQMVSKEIGEQFRVRKEYADKNNDTIRWGVSIFDLKDKSKDVRISPTIYLEEYYGKYLGGCSLAKIVRNIINLYHEVTGSFLFNKEHFAFDNLKDKICFKLVNQDMNIDLLAGMPHRQFCDLVVTYYVLLANDENGFGAIPINNSLMRMWNVDENTLWEFAYKNTRNLLPPYLKTTEEAIYECTGEIKEGGLPSFTLSNNRKHFGAATILYEDILHSVAETIQSSYVIMPSSIHEWVIFADNGMLGKESCDALVRYVNRTELAFEEILSEHAYYYDREKRKILY